MGRGGVQEPPYFSTVTGGEFEVLYYHTQTHSICSLGQHLPAQVGKQEGMHETEHMAKVRQTAL